MNKAELLRNPTSCLGRAAPDEPVFLLRANDPLFAPTIRLWAAMAQGGNLHEPEKIAMAMNEAAEGWKWREDRQPKAASGLVDTRSDHVNSVYRPPESSFFGRIIEGR